MIRDVGLHSRCKDAKGGQGKSKKDFCHEYQDPEVAASARGQQYLIKGYVGDEYTTKIKEICDALGSINVLVDEEEMVHICLGALALRCRPIWTTICMREKPLICN